MRNTVNHRKVLLLLLFVVGGFLWFQLGEWNHFVYRPGSEYSDLTITFWPNITYIQNCLRDYHQFPLWRTLIFSGSPFDVDPQSGLWYPPNLIFLFLPASLGFNIIVFFHLVFAGVGLWMWSRDLGISIQGSLLASLAYVFTPKVIAHLGFGHIGLVYGSAYIPWALWASRRLGVGDKWAVYFFGFFLGIQFIANPQLCYYTALVSVVYSVLSVWNNHATKHNISTIRLAFTNLVLGGGLAIGVAAAQLLPMIRFAPMSGRSGLGLSDSAISSIPFQYLWGLLVADRQGYMEYLLYFGVTALVLALFSLAHKESRFWWSFILLSLVFALGTNTPFYGLLFKILPGLDWVRSPARIYFLTVCALTMLAGRGFDMLLTLGEHRTSKFIRIIVFSLAAFALVLVCGYILVVGIPPANMLIFGLLTPATAFLCLLLSVRKLPDRIAYVGILLLLLSDLWIMDSTLIEGRESFKVLTDTGLGAYLRNEKQKGRFRVYSPSYSLSRQIGVIYGLESADGVDPLYLKEYDQYMQAASGVLRNRYEVTIPAMEGDLPVAIVNREAAPDLRLLGLLNVRFLAAEFPLEVEGLHFLDRFGNTYLYENTHFKERAFFTSEVVSVKSLNEAILRIREANDPGLAVVEGGQPLLKDKEVGVTNIQWLLESPNRIELEVENSQEGLLVISHVWYPDWKAVVDGKSEKLWKTDGVLSGVYLDPGSHRVILKYVPWFTYAALVISFVVILGLIGYWFSRNVK